MDRRDFLAISTAATLSAGRTLAATQNPSKGPAMMTAAASAPQPRVPYPDPASLSPDIQQLTQILNVNIFRMLAHSESLLTPVVYLGGTLRFDGSIDRGLLEVAILRVGYVSGAVYETSSHEVMARAHGIADSQFALIRQGASAKGLDPDHRLIIEFTDDLMQNIGASDKTLKPIIARFGIPGAQHLVLLVGYYMTICRFTLTFGVTADTPAPDAPASAVTMGSDGWARLKAMMLAKP